MRLPVIRKKKIKKRSSRKLLLILFVFFIIVFIILFFNSSISRIDTIDIRGNHFLTKQQIGQASEIELDDHFFAVRKNVIEKKVKDLELARSVKVTKRFPGHVIIEVEEYPKVAFQIMEDGTKSAVLANGTAVPIDGEAILDMPILTGWEANDPIKSKLSRVLETIPQEQLADISEIKPLPSAAYPEKIKLYTRSYFEVITTVEFLAEKMSYLDDIIQELNEDDITSGELTLLEADIHTPFDNEQNNSDMD